MLLYNALCTLSVLRLAWCKYDGIGVHSLRAFTFHKLGKFWEIVTLIMVKMECVTAELIKATVVMQLHTAQQELGS